MSRYNEYETTYLIAKNNLETAARNLSLEKSGRTIFGRIADPFFTSSAEQAHSDMKAEFRRVSSEIARSVVTDVRADMLALLRDEPDASSEYDRLHSQLQPLQTQLDAVTRIASQISNCKERITDAINAVSSAKTYEYMDSFSSNKAMSVMSSSETRSASSAVNEAQSALESLHALVDESKIERVALPQIDGTLDFVMDMAFDNEFDFTSIIQLVKLASAQDKLNEVLEKVSKLENEFSTARFALKPRVEALSASIESIVAPLLAEASRDVPQSLHYALDPLTLRAASLRSNDHSSPIP